MSFKINLNQKLSEYVAQEFMETFETFVGIHDSVTKNEDIIEFAFLALGVPFVVAFKFLHNKGYFVISLHKKGCGCTAPRSYRLPAYHKSYVESNQLDALLEDLDDYIVKSAMEHTSNVGI